MELVNPANSVAFQKKSLYLRKELKPKQLSGNTLRYVLKFHKYEFLLILLTVLSSQIAVCWVNTWKFSAFLVVICYQTFILNLQLALSMNEKLFREKDRVHRIHQIYDLRAAGLPGPRSGILCKEFSPFFKRGWFFGQKYFILCFREKQE